MISNRVFWGFWVHGATIAFIWAEFFLVLHQYGKKRIEVTMTVFFYILYLAATFLHHAISGVRTIIISSVSIISLIG